MRLSRPSTIILANAGLWVMSYAIITARVLTSEYMPDYWEMAWRRACIMLGGFLLCLAIDWALRRLTGWNLWGRAGVAIALAAAGGLGYALLNHLFFYVLDPRWGEAPPPGIFLTATWSFWIFLVWCGVSIAIAYEAELKDKTLRLLSAQALAADAQNRMLRYQINPHFLFNTLNALSSLILEKETARAEQVVLSLSSFLRFTLEKDMADKIPLGREIEAQKQYLSIEQARFEDRLMFLDRIPPALHDALVPALILQPLVENAVKYGVARSTRPVTIEIEAETRGDQLVIAVRDNGQSAEGPPPAKLGLGLENVRRRLEVMYGSSAWLEAGPRTGGGFEVRFALPLEAT